MARPKKIKIIKDIKSKQIEPTRETNSEHITKTIVKGQEFTNIKSIDALWGIKKRSDYKQTNIEEYEQFLADSTDTDLRNHVLDIGGIPNDLDRPDLVLRLTRRFRAESNKRSAPSNTNNVEVISSELNDRIRAIWES